MRQTTSSAANEQRRQRWLNFVEQLSPDTDPRTIRLVGLMHRVAHALYQVGESSLAGADLSYAQYRLLMQLLFSERFEAGGALNPSDISDRQGVSRNTISALIRNLEKEGLIERELDETDRRRFLIRLTPAGRARVEDHASRHFRAVHACFHNLTPEDQARLSDLLEKLSQSASFVRQTQGGAR